VFFVTTSCAPGLSPIASASPGSGLIGWGCLPGITQDWYVTHGQWRADVRTALAAFLFVLSADLDNSALPVVRQRGAFLSATTKSGTKTPRV
jgi:hypothetical protein